MRYSLLDLCETSIIFLLAGSRIEGGLLVAQAHSAGYMAPELYTATLLTELPDTMQRPAAMADFHAYAPYTTDGPLEIKVVYHLPACDAIKEYIVIVKAALQIMPGKYVDVLYSPLAHWKARHPGLHH